jgi:hypothetical protein
MQETEVWHVTTSVKMPGIASSWNNHLTFMECYHLKMPASYSSFSVSGVHLLADFGGNGGWMPGATTEPAFRNLYTGGINQTRKR